MEAVSRKYVKISTLKRILYILSIVSCIFLIFMKYDVEFKGVIAFPICYFMCVFLFVREKCVSEIGSIMLIIMYGFRMCLLPIICAYGNFFLEPEKDIYIAHYPATVLLTCVECLIVFASLLFWGKYYMKRKLLAKKYEERKMDGGVIKLFLMVTIFLICAIFCLYPALLGQFGTIFIEPQTGQLQEYGTMYYLTLLLDMVGRPILFFSVVEYLLEKKSNRCAWLAVFVSMIAVLITSDRRIYSMLIGGVCLLHIMISGQIKLKKKYMYGIIVILAITTLFFGFYGEDTPIRIARKFQRYFSGPTLTAIGLEVYEQYNQNIGTLVSLVFNCSIVLGGMFGSIPMENYVVEICGKAGKSIWTPMTVGALQCVGGLFPFVLMFIVWFIVYCDFRTYSTRQTKHIMIYSFLSISSSIYMIMYSVQLILYNILFIGTFYVLLVFLDKKYRIKVC